MNRTKRQFRADLLKPKQRNKRVGLILAYHAHFKRIKKIIKALQPIHKHDNCLQTHPSCPLK